MWQALHAELEPLGLTVVTVALDLDPDKARPFVDAAASTHPSLVDAEHRIDELFGITNVPMAVWIDESGTLVRPAEAASISPSPYAAIEINDAMPERLQHVLGEMQQMPDTGEAYRAAIVDWAQRGTDSPFALSPDAVIDASQPRSADHSRAAAGVERRRGCPARRDDPAGLRGGEKAPQPVPPKGADKRPAGAPGGAPPGRPAAVGPALAIDPRVPQNVTCIVGPPPARLRHTGEVPARCCGQPTARSGVTL